MDTTASRTVTVRKMTAWTLPCTWRCLQLHYTKTAVLCFPQVLRKTTLKFQASSLALCRAEALHWRNLYIHLQKPRLVQLRTTDQSLRFVSRRRSELRIRGGHSALQGILSTADGIEPQDSSWVGISLCPRTTSLGTQIRLMSLVKTSCAHRSATWTSVGRKIHSWGNSTNTFLYWWKASNLNICIQRCILRKLN